MKLRPHQKRVYDLILANINKGIKKQAIALPTGAGKTFLASEIVKHYLEEGKKVFFLVANSPLVEQTRLEFLRNGIVAGVVKSGNTVNLDYSANVQILMLQTYVRRMDDIDIIEPDLIIMDECDFCWTGQMVKKLFTKHPDIFFVGISATIINDKGYLLSGFDFYDDKCTIKELQQQGFLSKDKNFIPLAIDTSNVRVMGTGEFNDKDLDDNLNKNYIIKDIVNTYKKINLGYKAIAFGINIKHAENLQKEFCNAGITACVIHSKLKKFQIDYWLKAHRTGKIQILINVGMTIRGYNDVDVIDIIFTRPTNSERLYLQACGRGGRMDTAGHGFFRILDYAGNIERFGLWSENRIYSLTNGAKRETEFRPIVCPMCFSVIYTNNSKCPECEFILREQQETRTREINESLRTSAIIEIKQAYGAEGVIASLSKLLGKNGNTYYYLKLLPLFKDQVTLDAFNSEITRLANYARRQRYNPNYVFWKLKEKLNKNA